MKKTEEKDELNLMTLAREYSDEDKARRPAGIVALAGWRGLPALPESQGKGDLRVAVERRQQIQSPQGRSQMRRVPQAIHNVTVGTIFEDSHLPISKWLMAIFILCSSKKSVSANQLSRMLKITYKAAWFVNHRLRFAMTPEMPLAKLLKGIVEVDETFVGGKGERRTRYLRQTPVVALIERDGNMHTRVIPRVSHTTSARF